MKFTFYGHSSFLIETEQYKILFDPFISPNPKASEINLSEIEADYICISHGHEDHLADAEFLLKQTNATLITNYEIAGWFEAKGIKKIHPVNHGGSATFPFGKLKYVNAVHSSALPDGSYGGNPGGFIIENKDTCFYFSGDTALHYDMKLIGELHSLDFAILCVGDNFTMGAADATICANWVNVDKVIGVHFDTFPYIEIDHLETIELFSKKDVQLTLPTIGQVIEL